MRLIRTFLSIIAITAISAISAQAAAVPITGVIINVAGQTIQLPASADGSVRIGDPISIVNVGQIVARIDSLNALLDADPFIAYGIAVTNLSAVPLTFNFSFSSPYLGGPYNSLESSHSSSVTDSGSRPDGSITVSPVLPLTNIHNPHIDGVPVTAANLGAGCALAGAPGFSASCNTNPLVAVPVSTFATGFFDVTVGFTLSPNDIYTANGRVELKNTAVQESGTFTLLGLGLTAIGFVSCRRRSKAL
jgi:hypothetical protein